VFSLTFRPARLGRLDRDPLVPAPVAMKSCSVCCVNLLCTRGRIGDSLAGFCRGFRIHWLSRSRCGVGATVKSCVSDDLQNWVVGNERASGAVGAGARFGRQAKVTESHGWNAEMPERALGYYERRNRDEGSRWTRVSRETAGRVFEDRGALGFLTYWRVSRRCAQPRSGFWQGFRKNREWPHERDHFAGRTLVMLEPSRTIWRLFLGIRKLSADCGALLPLGFSSFRSGYALACIAELGRNWNDFS
jgi:hypothetical protein